MIQQEVPMARKQTRPQASHQQLLEPLQTTCRACGNRMRMTRHSQRTVTTLQGVTHLTLKVYRCRNTTCPRFHQATRPEEEGRWAVPHGEFGLDVIALVGMLRYQEQRSIPQIYQELQRRGVQIAQRTVTDQLYRYEELLALHLADSEWLQARLKEQQQVILALDGGLPDVGHEVLWVLRDCGSGEVLVARSPLSSNGKRPSSASGGGSQPLPETGYPYRRSHYRWATLDPQRRRACLARGSSSALSFPSTVAKPPSRSLMPTDMPRKS